MGAARRLGVPEGTVKSRTHYALRALKLALEEMGVGGSDWLVGEILSHRGFAEVLEPIYDMTGEHGVRMSCEFDNPRDQVDRRDDAEDDDRADPDPHAPAGRDVAAEGDERQARHHQADQPEIALPVLPELRRALGHRAAGGESAGIAGGVAGHVVTSCRGVYRTIRSVNLVDQR